MKLKDRPLPWWNGRKFSYWCRADRNDETKIHYTLNWFSIGKGWAYLEFTSDDEVNGNVQHVVSNSFVHEIRKEDGEWFVTLDYPFYYENPWADEAVVKTRHQETV